MKLVVPLLICMRFIHCKEWDRHMVLDSDQKYHVWWTFSEENIRFKVEVATKGWVGFGISPNGGMAGSDVIISWVSSDGTIKFSDRYAKGKFMPLVDDHQDWHLLWSEENDTHTVIAFERALITCDQQDFPISDETTKVIYAYGYDDPISPLAVKYHGPINRGSKSVLLLQTSKQRGKLKTDEDLRHIDVRSNNILIPHDSDTTYLCSLVEAPEIIGYNHIIRIEPHIQKGNERFVHHMVLYQCGYSQELLKHFPRDKSHVCYDESQNSYFIYYCTSAVAGWATGGESFNYPDNAGRKIGKSIAAYYLLEVHYDNPGFAKGVRDSSGLRLIYTPKLRQYNANAIAIGNIWYPCMFIPPRQKEFTVSGHAHRACLSQGLPKEGIKVFAVLLHSHLIGKAIAVRHFRGNEELPPLANDRNYDFNYQEVRVFSEPVTVLPTDHLIVECIYDSSQRKETTFGGLGTKQEMCVAVLMYYPEISLTIALSCPSPHLLVKALGVTEISDDDRYVISSITGKNESYVDFLSTYPWDSQSVKRVQKYMKYSPQLNMCAGQGGQFYPVFILSRYPELTKHYKEPDMCSKSGRPSSFYRK